MMREDPRVAVWFDSKLSDDRVMTCTIVRGEILFGLGRLSEGRRRAELEAKAQEIFAALCCEPVPAAAADLYASVKLAQQRRGLPLDENDLWIASTALAIGATLVIRDSDFRRLEDLPVILP